MTVESKTELIVAQLRKKSCMKQDVFQNTTKHFEQLKKVLSEIADDLKIKMAKSDQRIEIEYRSRGKYEAELRFAGDVLIFQMHTNVFSFDENHSIHKSSYVKEDELRAYCGMINIYNFLADSIKYNRYNDSGYLVARLFLNREDHFFVEGKPQFGYRYNDFMNKTLSLDILKDIIQATILYTLDFDLLTPPYEHMKEITVHEVHELTNEMKIKTGKRLGFQFESDSDSH
ncbi:hypothetical protein N9R81_01420 [Flavobacteriales bacterium]|nr:hypothetical protein [Flavobacteriales bacterium]